MDETEKQIVEWRRSEVLSPARELEAPKWEQWSDRRSAELWQVVALSLGCAPLHRPKLRVFVGVATTTPAPQQKASAAPRLPGDDLSSLITIELLDRLRINSDFVFRLEAATDHLGSTEAGERTKVSFQDFRRLADRLNWKLSEGFVSLAPCTSSGNEVPLIACMVLAKKKAGQSFITVRQAVDLLAEAHGAATSAAAAQLIDMLNDAVHEGRPALYERDGPALKVVADPGERYVAVIQSLDALRRGPPADDRNDPLANTRRDLRRRRMGRAGIPGAGWYDTEFTLYPRKIAVLDLVEVRAAVFERFALLAPEVSSARLEPPEPAPYAVIPVPKRTRTPPPSEEPQTVRKRRTPTVQEVIAPYVAKVMRAHPDYTADDLYNHMRRDAGNDGSPFSRVTTGGKLFCVENSKNCSLASAIAAMTAYNKTR